LLQAKLVGERFKKLSAEEKEKYETMAKADKERYKKEMAAFKRGDFGKIVGKESDSEGLNEEQDDDVEDGDD
jgi:structure-specific recognition protein 1